jgi:hypothetical protein
VGFIIFVWFVALIVYLSKGYFRPHSQPASPVSSSRRISFDQVIDGEFFPQTENLEWTRSGTGDGHFLVRYDFPNLFNVDGKVK